MKPYSAKRAARNRECVEWRRQLIARVGYCELCGHDASRTVLSRGLCVHEIARGPNRHKAQDKAFATLVVCSRCHDEKVASKAEWPESRQLAALKRTRPGDYSLSDYLALAHPSAPLAITQDEVDAWQTERR